MKQALDISTAAVVLCSLAWQAAGGGEATATFRPIGDANLQVTIDKTSGLPTDIESCQHRWLTAPGTLTVKRETTGASAAPTDGMAVDNMTVQASLAPLGLAMSSRWSQERNWLVWDMGFTGQTRRSGYEVVLDLPLLLPSLRIFTPSDRGVLDLSMHATFKPVKYGNYQFETDNGDAYVLPLVSVFDPASDRALTIALPPDGNIPHMQVEWKDASILRISMGHRGMGGGKSSPLRLLFTTHAADYRSVLAAYAARYPAYFETPMPRGDHEGAFWYHHIQAHPDFKEMERQNVRFIWSSFWFTHLGEYLPEEKEWFPWTYAKWWSLGTKMSDRRINAFIDEMHRHGIAAYAYFNVTEYGGSGGKGGDTAEATRMLKQRFANALVKDAEGKPIPTWEGAMAMNARREYALRPFLQEQIRRHIERLPRFDGFIIDRLDWGSSLDYGHDDGLTMVGDRPADNMAGAVAEAVQDVCRLSHAAGKRVFVNQFWRVELMREVDGSCHESDYLAQRYLIPFRPATAWEQQRPYVGQRDLAAFEAHLKQRLQIALLPQMIAHRFAISQQAADESAADLLELFAPLFKAFAGKRQVLQPHCVGASGLNDVNLFIDGQRRYVVPVTSRTRFVTRGDRSTEPVEVTISMPDAPQLTWAHAIPIGGKPYRPAIHTGNGKAIVCLPHHGAATVLVLGKGNPAALDDVDAARLQAVLDTRFPPRQIVPAVSVSAPTGPPGKATEAKLSIDGSCFYHPGPFAVQLGNATVGTLSGNAGSFPCKVDDFANLVVRIIAGDDGVWFLPERIRLTLQTAGKTAPSATWTSGEPVEAGRSPRELVLPLRWTQQTPETADRSEQPPAAVPPRRPADFRPFHFEYSTEQLMRKFSTRQMERAAKELKEIQSVNEKGPWKPTCESLDRHQAPEWFRDAKLGIMLNWGLHSVPAWDQPRSGTARYPDAYGCWMYTQPGHVAHHAKYWGSDFQYDDFVTYFRAENYDPEALATLFQESGARYLITMSKHHDGVAWWDSQWTQRNFVRMGPKRDLLSPLIAAARKRGLKTLMYFCYEEYATALLDANDTPCYRIWNLGAFAGIHPLTAESRRRVSGNIPVRNYYDHYMTPLVKEMIDRFDPDGLWMDGDWTTPPETLHSLELTAYFYNKTAGRKEVLVNDRLGLGVRDIHGDYRTSEYNVAAAQSLTRPWEECQGISQSFAYNYEDNDESLGPPARLIHRLIDVVSHNGNLAIIGGPQASGAYPDNILRRLRALGAWLKVNGEAIYVTRVLPPCQEGDVSYTRSKDAKFAYAICKQWPGKSLSLKAVLAENDAKIYMLGVGPPLPWKQDAQGLTILLPDTLQDEKTRPCRDAWALKIPVQPTVVSMTRKDFAAPVTLETVGICDRVVYTLDGSQPRPNSAAYGGPILLPAGETSILKARCLRGGKLVGRTLSSEFHTSPPLPPKPSVYLEALEPLSFKTGWQAEGVKTWRNVNCHGQPLKVLGETFAHGVGMHANGEVVFSLKPQNRRFVCRVGIDDAAEGAGSARVTVYLDQKLLCQTPVLTGKDGLWNIDVRLDGPTDHSRLRIVIDDNGDGISGDNVDFVDAGFVN